MKNFSSRICKRCNSRFIPEGPRAEYCAPCRPEHTKEKLKAAHQARYQKKGYNQFGKANNNWRGGIGTYRRADLPANCEVCGSTKFLCVHHKDHNRYNNELSNLMRLCKRCHQIEHGCINNLPQFRKALDSDSPSKETSSSESQGIV